MSTEHSEQILLNEREAAAAVGLSTRTLFNLRKSGALAYVQFGKAIRYRRADLEALASKLLVTVPAK